MLKLLAALSPAALLVSGALAGGLPAAAGAWWVGRALGHRAGFQAGSAAMAAEVERRNAAAAETARRAKRGVDACYDAGGSWNQETGRCDR